MAVVRQFKFAVTGTEVAFMQGLIDYICGLGTGITCEDENGNPTTALYQLTDSGVTQAQFVFNFGNNIKWGFKRGYANNSSAKNYNVGIFGSSSTTNLSFAPNVQAVSTEVERAYYITSIKSDNFTAIWLSTYAQSAIQDNYSPVFIRILNGGENYALCVFNGAKTSFRNGTFTSNNNVACTFKPLFNYTTVANSIDYIDRSVFISGDIKLFDFSEIYSCTNVTFGTTIALSDGRIFWAIDANAMVELSGNNGG